MRKTFITNLILLVLLNLLVKPFYILGIETEIQNRVGAETYGSYFALINFSFVLNILLDIGITNWNTRHIAQNPQLISKHFGPLLTIRLGLAALYLAIAIVTGLVLGYHESQLSLLVVLAIGQVFASGILFIRSNLTGLHMFKHDSVISVLDRILLLLSMAYLLWFQSAPFQMEWLVYGQCVTYMITFFLALFFVTKKAKGWKLKPNFTFSRSIIKSSFPYAAMILISSIAYRIDSILLERISGSHEAGIYAMGFRFFEAVNMMAYLFAVLLLPLFAGMIKRNESINHLLVLSFKIMLTAAATLAVCCIFWRSEILNLFYHQQVDQASDSFGLLMIGCAAFCLQYIVGTLLTAAGKLRILIIIAIGGMIVNLLMNFWLIPIYGNTGAAFSNAITQSLILFAQMIVVGKIYAPQWRKDLLRGLIFTLCIAGFGYFFSQNTIFEGRLAYAIATFSLCSVIAAWLVGMFDLRSIKQLIINRNR